MLKVSVLGATGYAGAELVRLLKGHPGVQIVHITSASNEGSDYASLYPSWQGAWKQPLDNPAADVLAQDSDIVFTALPHGVSMETVSVLYDRGAAVIDLSGDFRYIDVAVYEKWYKVKHPRPELLKDAVYGLPELHREKIKKTRLVGNPGCYTTTAILSLAPLMKQSFIDPGSIIINALSGVTGAGRKASTPFLFCEVDENAKAYNLATHRHTSEIEQELSLLAGKEILLQFSPHLIPVKRGILSTAYVNLTGPVTQQQVQELYTEYYKDEPFVTVYPAGMLPELKNVNGSNNVHIGLVLDGRTHRLMIVTALDNLIKGAGGQAVQNMNLMAGFDETTGLAGPGWYL